MRARLIVLLVAASLLSGCSTPLPTYPWQGPHTAIAALAERTSKIHSVRATGTLVLTSATNQHVTLDAAIVAREAGPEHPGQAFLRIRAWKFGQAVLDLTARPDGLWIASDRASSDLPPDNRMKELKPEQIPQAWNLFFGDFFTKPGLSISDAGGRTFTAHRRDQDATITCDIERTTLTARTYRITDAQGHLRETLTLARYQLVGDTPWPMLLIALGDGGQVQVRFDDVDVNPDLEDAVFTPPHRAVKQP